MRVIIKPTARRTIDELAEFIANELKMPDTALRYTDKLIDFAYDLALYSNAYPTCHHKPWAEMGLKCATFDKKYVFAFKIIRNNVVIYFIKHGKLLY